MQARLVVATEALVDALLNATGCTIEQVHEIAERYPGARGILQLRQTLNLADGGAESPQETRVRLLLVRSGIPRPRTQTPVKSEWGRVVRRVRDALASRGCPL